MRRYRRAARWLATLGCVALLTAACGHDDATTTATAAPSGPLVDIGQGLQGPSGTSATVYATGLAHVSALAFDGDGRLWAATAAFQDDGTDAVWMIPSAGATPVKVLSGVHTPLGLLWIDDTLYVSSAERVDAYRTFDGTQFGSQQDVVTFPAGVGEVNGMALSPEGRIVLGISAPCDACVPTSELSGSVVSFLPDGSDLRVEARNIRAPIDFAYYPGTDDLFVTMNQQDGLGDRTPGDWLSIVNSGQDWRFPECYGQGGSDCQGAPAPVAELDKHAAVSGVAMVTGQLGDAVGNAALVAEWTEAKVLQVTLVPDGSGDYSTAVEPFVTGLDKPVPVITSPDGSVLIGDWGSGTIYAIAAT